MTWSTTDEIRFINGLGNHRSPRAVIPVEEKLEFLKRYRQGIDLRRLWGAINQAEIRRYVDQRIKYYEKQLSPDPYSQQTDEKEN